jgi:septal ring factor EnvC (AmiA/AmiB activator)
MTERARIADRLKRKEQEIQSFEEKIRSARIYVQALRDVLKMLDPGSETVLRAGSAVTQARDVIMRAKMPVHINDILEQLGKEVTREGRASLTSSLAAYVRRGDIFTRTAPNTFGLIELGHEPTEDEPLKPPAGFGHDVDSPDDDDDIPF